MYHRTFTVRSLKRATMLITVSDSTKRDAHELASIPLERMQTVYPCIDERFSQAPDAKAIQSFREQQSLTGGYILYMSTLEPRKNIPTLIEAYAQLRQRYGIREKLVLAGGKGWLYDTIFARVQELDLENEVIFPGFVADTEQTLWYHAASIFAFPSLYEGFGIPVAEALACGIPVVTSNISSLPEAGAGLALCVDPHNVEALAEALHRTITDSILRNKCKAMAPTVAQQFSAITMAERTREVYERAGARHISERRSQQSTFVVQ
jgi:glycosyltransferase involved in cell wall biosynthesis